MRLYWRSNQEESEARKAHNEGPIESITIIIWLDRAIWKDIIVM